MVALPQTTSSQVDPLGLTLSEYAAHLGKHPQAVRPAYTQLMRQGIGATLPAISRIQTDEQDSPNLAQHETSPPPPLAPMIGVTKFCIPVENPSPLSPSASTPPLETESVIIPMNSYRGTSWYTLCLSSQVGCRMGCTFCQTGRMGLLKNLTAAQIVRQRLVARQLLQKIQPDSPDKPASTEDPANWAQRGPRYFADGIQNLVFMGMGEPLDNFEEVLQAIRVFNDPAGMDFPLTQITISTVGRIDGLKKLADLIRSNSAGIGGGGWNNLRIAISLNAATDKLRDELMPINKGMPLADLQKTLLEYPLHRKGRFLIEYVLIKGVNDSDADADAVAAWCKPLPCTINLIPYNPQHQALYDTPAEATINRFLFRLKDQGLFVKRRITHGRDLMSACGQLGNPELQRAKKNAKG